MSQSLVDSQCRDRVGIVTLNRPEALNAMNSRLRLELAQAIEAMDNDPEVRVLVLTGAGRAFSSGADIKEQVRQEEAQRPASAAGPASDVASRLMTCRKPVIACVNGLAHGGGALLASVADLRFGCERSEFRFPGVVYGRINATWILALLLGPSKAKDLLLSARVVPAKEAFEMGLLNRLLPAASLLEETLAYAALIASHAPEMTQGIKRLVDSYPGMSVEQMFIAERNERTTVLTPPMASQAFRGFMDRHS